MKTNFSVKLIYFPIQLPFFNFILVHDKSKSSIILLTLSFVPLVVYLLFFDTHKMTFQRKTNMKATQI